MSSGRNSRISQILMSHPVFSDRDGHRLKEILSNANNDIEKYFIEEDGKIILQTIRNTLSVLNSQDMSDEAKLETSDIQLKAILERFFAKGVIMAEGDAENLLLPVLAEILGYPLEKYGISIVNVGSTAFLRYSRIFIKKRRVVFPNAPTGRLFFLGHMHTVLHNHCRLLFQVPLYCSQIHRRDFPAYLLLGHIALIADCQGLLHYRIFASP